MNSDKNDTNQDRTDPLGSGAEKPDQPTRTTFLKDLLARRVPHILGGYLAASWIILEFMDWLVRRYPISPNLVEILPCIPGCYDTYRIPAGLFSWETRS